MQSYSSRQQQQQQQQQQHCRQDQRVSNTRHSPHFGSWKFIALFLVALPNQARVLSLPEEQTAGENNVFSHVDFSLLPRNSLFDDSDPRCHESFHSFPASDSTSAKGLVFSIRSNINDGDGVRITSFGFHVDPTRLPDEGADYEAYALIKDGYYADPERNEENSPEQFDYRGDIEKWNKIAEGRILKDDLSVSQISGVLVETFFKIPYSNFNSTLVSPNGGIRSFYLAVKESVFQYGETNGEQLNSEQLIFEQTKENWPELLVGEGVSEYLFPTTPYLYSPRLFMGKVYFEIECRSQAPSISAGPSVSPTVTSSSAPSLVPSSSLAPSNSPSLPPTLAPTEIPSWMPSIYIETVSSGLLLTMEIPECQSDENFSLVDLSEEERNLVVDIVTEVAAAAASESEGITNVEVTLGKIVRYCGNRRLSTVSDETIAELDSSVISISFLNSTTQLSNRRLPTGSSALDFSMIITGEYRPPSRPGNGEKPSNLPDLGKIAEDSINANPGNFAKKFQERAPDSSPLSQVSSPKIVALPIPEDGRDLTRKPSFSPTLSPTAPLKEDNTDSILVVCVVILSGIFVLLGAFLLFRYAERKAIKKRRKTMEIVRQEKIKEKKDIKEKKWHAEADEPHGSFGGSSIITDEQSWSNKNKGGGYGYNVSPEYGPAPPPPLPPGPYYKSNGNMSGPVNHPPPFQAAPYPPGSAQSPQDIRHRHPNFQQYPQFNRYGNYPPPPEQAAGNFNRVMVPQGYGNPPSSRQGLEDVKYGGTWSYENSVSSNQAPYNFNYPGSQGHGNPMPSSAHVAEDFKYDSQSYENSPPPSMKKTNEFEYGGTRNYESQPRQAPVVPYETNSPVYVDEGDNDDDDANSF